MLGGRCWALGGGWWVVSGEWWVVSGGGGWFWVGDICNVRNDRNFFCYLIYQNARNYTQYTQWSLVVALAAASNNAIPTREQY